MNINKWSYIDPSTLKLKEQAPESYVLLKPTNVLADHIYRQIFSKFKVGFANISKFSRQER